MRQIHWKIREQLMEKALEEISALVEGGNIYSNVTYASQRAKSALLACQGYELSNVHTAHTDIASGKHLEIVLLTGESVSAIEHVEGRLYRLLLSEGKRRNIDQSEFLYARPLESSRDEDSPRNKKATPEGSQAAQTAL
jgi:hypothetical protein